MIISTLLRRIRNVPVKIIDDRKQKRVNVSPISGQYFPISILFSDFTFVTQLTLRNTNESNICGSRKQVWILFAEYLRIFYTSCRGQLIIANSQVLIVLPTIIKQFLRMH